LILIPTAFFAIVGLWSVHIGLYGFADSKPSDKVVLVGVAALILAIVLPVLPFVLKWYRRRTES
jgi:hypothetical protein